jgi:hypothetical protein
MQPARLIIAEKKDMSEGIGWFDIEEIIDRYSALSGLTE